MTDIRLDDGDGSFVTLDARVVKVQASDFMLDAADRRHGGGPNRRAMVHDQGDGLTLNFAGDYPGGVTISGPLHTSGPVHLAGVTEIAPQNGRLVVHGDISYEEQNLVLVGGHGQSRTVTVILTEELSKLRGQITDLTARIAALEARPHA